MAGMRLQISIAKMMVLVLISRLRPRRAAVRVARLGECLPRCHRPRPSYVDRRCHQGPVAEQAWSGFAVFAWGSRC